MHIYLLKLDAQLFPSSTYLYFAFSYEFELFFLCSAFKSVWTFMHIKQATGALPVSLDMPVKSLLLAWKQAKCGNKNQPCHYSRQQDVLWAWSPGDSGGYLEVKRVMAISWVIPCICFFLKLGSSTHMKRAASPRGLSPCYGHAN